MAKSKRYVQVRHVDGRERPMTQDVYSRLGSVIYKGQKYDKGGWTIVEKAAPKVPEVSEEAKALVKEAQAEDAPKPKRGRPKKEA